MRTRVKSAVQPAAAVRFCLVFPCEAISIPVVRHVLGETLRKLGVRDEPICDLLLAVSEACTNVLRHSGPGSGYEVTAAVSADRCVVEILDNGCGFDARRRFDVSRRFGATSRLDISRRFEPDHGQQAVAARPAASVAQIPESGRGLSIMRAFVDDVTLRSRPGCGTVVSLAKRIELRSDALLAGPELAQLRDAG